MFPPEIFHRDLVSNMIADQVINSIEKKHSDAIIQQLDHVLRHPQSICMPTIGSVMPLTQQSNPYIGVMTYLDAAERYMGDLYTRDIFALLSTTVYCELRPRPPGHRC